MKRNNLLKVTNLAILDRNVKYSLATADLNPDVGYLVSLPKCRETAEYIDRDILANYVKRRAHKLYQEGTYLHIYEEGGVYVLDTCDLHEQKRNAYFYAIARGQWKFHDNATNDEVTIP